MSEYSAGVEVTLRSRGRSLDRLLALLVHGPVAGPVELEAGLVHRLTRRGDEGGLHRVLPPGEGGGTALGAHDVGVDEPRDVGAGHLDGELVPLVTANLARERLLRREAVGGEGVDVEVGGVRLLRRVVQEVDVLRAAATLALAL